MTSVIAILAHVVASVSAVGFGALWVRERRAAASTTRGLEQALAGMRKELARAQRLGTVGRLSAGIAHEAKNPLTAIIGMAQLARDHLGEPERMRELLDSIEREGRRGSAVLGKLLGYGGAAVGMRQLVLPNALVSETTRMLRPLLAQSDVDLTASLDEATPGVEVDVEELRQVLVNLVLNAQQAMPAGGAVRIGTSRDGQARVVISVSDNGPGLPDGVREHLFEPFYTTKPAGQGTGLGLWVSANLIRAHNGTLEAESAPGAGTTFKIILPAAQPPAPRGT